MERTSPDLQLQAFFRDNERFADVFNSCLFHGEHWVNPQTLRELDTDVSANLLSLKFQAALKRTRDVVKFSTDGTCYRILGLEHQQHIHYAMPLRTMVYDVLSYLKQAEEIGRRNRHNKNYTDADEFLSGMTRTDRLIPCYTIVIYWGEKLWDGPRTLPDMMDFGIPGKPPYFQSYAPACLICANEPNRYPFKNQDVSQLFQLVYALNQHGRNIPEAFQDVSLETACTAAAITGTKTHLRKVFKDAVQNRKERINMWEILKKELAEEKAKGQVELTVRMIKNGMPLEMARKYSELKEQQWNEVLTHLKH